MRLYLSQHAKAKSKHEDPERPLSEQGRADIQALCSYLAEHGDVRIDAIFHSGKRRAQQTAECIGAYASPTEGTHPAEGLSPMDDPAIWANRLEEEHRNLALVGHLPHMSKLASVLLSGDPENEIVQFSQGGMLALEREAGRWRLRWMLIPELIIQ
jgi:phosphohistidine phosphatase